MVNSWQDLLSDTIIKGARLIRAITPSKGTFCESLDYPIGLSSYSNTLRIGSQPSAFFASPYSHVCRRLTFLH